MVNINMSRYSRHIVLSEIGQIGQDKLSKAKVLVIGAGGLGCPVLQYLTAAGVGTIGIIDFDIVEESNLQRQVLFGSSDLGKNKALAAKERLSDLNDTITIYTYPYRLTHLNALALFSLYDIIVDGSDNFTTRYLVNDASVITNKPLVYGAILKFEGQVAVFNYKNGPSYRCLFPTPPKVGSVANCSEIGVLGVLPGIIGSMQANEVLKLILDLGNPLSGRVLIYNALTTSITTLAIPRSERIIQEIVSKRETFQELNYAYNCEMPILEITMEGISELTNVQFIDVREPHETPKVALENMIQIPLSRLEDQIKHLNSAKEKVFFCAVGERSRKVVSILQKHQIYNCYSLKEGVHAILAYQKNSQYERS